MSELMLSHKQGEAGLKVLKRKGLPETYFITQERLESKENLVLEGIEQDQEVKARL